MKALTFFVKFSTSTVKTESYVSLERIWVSFFVTHFRHVTFENCEPRILNYFSRNGLSQLRGNILRESVWEKICSFGLPAKKNDQCSQNWPLRIKEYIVLGQKKSEKVFPLNQIKGLIGEFFGFKIWIRHMLSKFHARENLKILFWLWPKTPTCFNEQFEGIFSRKSSRII